MLDFKKKNNSFFKFYFGPFVDQRVAALHVNKRRYNFFFTLTDLTGAVMVSLSAKSFASNRKKRVASHVIDLIMKRLIGVLRAYCVKAVRLFFRISSKRVLYPICHSFRNSGLSVVYIGDFIKLAHNGCRMKKTRRIRRTSK